MRKMFSLVAFTALVAMSSCSNNEIDEVAHIVGDPSFINLSPFTGVQQSRVADNTIISLQTAASFQVYTTQGNNPTVFAWGNTSLPYEYNAPGAATPNTWSWNKKWEDITAYPATFTAVFPTQMLTDPAAPKFNHTVPVNQTTGASHIDLIGARATVANTPSSGVVPFAFNHLLSKINFAIEAGTGVTVHLQSIKLANAATTGTYNFVGNTWSNQVLPTAAPAYYGYSKNTPTAEVISGVTSTPAAGASLMMIPGGNTAWTNPGITGNVQNSLATGTFVEVIYRLTDIAGAKDLVGYGNTLHDPVKTMLTTTGPLFVKVAYPVGTTWLSNNQYLYTISLGTAGSSGGILISDKFVDGNGNTTDVSVVDPTIVADLIAADPTTTNLNDAKIIPGEPIVDQNQFIGLTVKVNAWTAPATTATLK